MKTLLIIPPFTQLNSPYASLPFLKGTLNKRNKESDIFDLSIETASKLFSKDGLTKLSEKLVFKDKERYINIIDDVVDFLRDKNNIADKIIEGNYLPKGKILSSALDMDSFDIPSNDYAKYLASLFIDDVFLFYKNNMLAFQVEGEIKAGCINVVYGGEIP